MYLHNLLHQIQEIYSGNPWLGETFQNKLNDIDDTTAFIIPVKGLHSIAEIVSHVTEWKKEIVNRFITGKRQLSMHDPSDWRTNDELRQEGWQHLKSELFKSNNEFFGYLSTKDDIFLDISCSAKLIEKNRYFIEGCLHHDIYHLGQIGLVKKLVMNTFV